MNYFGNLKLRWPTKGTSRICVKNPSLLVDVIVVQTEPITILDIQIIKSILRVVDFYVQHHPCKYISAYDESSVTRWLNYLFNIWPFRTMKNWPIVKIFVKVGSQFGHILNILSRNGRILFFNFPKVAKFRQIWSHCSEKRESE